MRHRWFVAASFQVLLLTPAAMAQPPSAGYEWATVGAPGNAPIPEPPVPPPKATHTPGRGSVDHFYRMAKTEVSTGQWVEFLNSFSNTAAPHPFWDGFFGPTIWGAAPDPSFPGPGTRYVLRNVPNAAQRPVGGIGWRMGALYCNWLHNGKGSDPASLITGSYDSTTWGYVPGSPTVFTDGWTHLPGAQYWIPTMDEQLKSFYYDPDRFGPSQGGWWNYTNKSDSVGVPGLPGQGTTSAGYMATTSAGWAIPLGAYTTSLSPWGLLDTSGGTSEWSEDVWLSPDPETRRHVGSFAGGSVLVEDIYRCMGTGTPDFPTPYWNGLRIASAVPSPITLVPLGIAGMLFAFTHTRRRT